MAIFIISFISLLLSSSSTNAASRSLLIKLSDIENACLGEGRKAFEQATCVKVLTSDPKIVASKTLLDLANNIIDAGFKSTNSTKAHIESLLKDPKAPKGGLKECKNAYDFVVITFKYGKKDIKEDPYTSNYDFLIAATDDLRPCLKAIADNGIKDEILDEGNMLVPIYAFSVNQVVDTISGYK